MMSGYLKNTRIGKELMKTSRTELGIVLAIAMASFPLAGCGKPEPSPTAAAQPAAAKPAAAADKAHEKPGERPHRRVHAAELRRAEALQGTVDPSPGFDV